MQTLIDELIQLALIEDIGSGDRTSEATIDPDLVGSATILAKSPGIICGLNIAEQVFSLIDPTLEFRPLVDDGIRVTGKREPIAKIDGSLRSIVIGERTALNFMQRLCGVATLTAQYVDAIADYTAQVVDTRKTIPGWRQLDKYAVRVGGGKNHRFGLYDAIFIKDNHIAAIGSIQKAVDLARHTAPHTLRIEVEAATIDQVNEAIEASADIILLDNMSIDQLRESVKIVANRALTEASGGVNLTTIRAIAETGVDFISVGALTHSAVALDISLDIDIDD